MRGFSGLLAALAVFAGSAHAAPVTYGMTFFDEVGAAIGTGSLSYDPAVKEDVYIDGDQGAPCSPASPDCFLAATWTPLSFIATILGFPFVSDGDQFLEGSYVPPGKCGCGHLLPGDWSTIDPSFGDGLAFYTPDFGLAGSFLAGDTGFPFFYIEGSVTFARISAVPLPAAAWLFIAGAAGLISRGGARTPRPKRALTAPTASPFRAGSSG